MRCLLKKEIPVQPRNVKGFRDISPAFNRLRWRIIDAARSVYEKYGFEHWDTPVLEYAECIGKYLPDEDEVSNGVYSFSNPEQEPVLDGRGREKRDTDNNVIMENHPLAMRYDLTAPLARLYAAVLLEKMNQGQVQGPETAPLFRRYQFGPVYRYEAKLDPGRYREFWQMDFDTAGSADAACDAEVCRILCDSLEATGFRTGSYEVRVGHRMIHMGLFEKIGLDNDAEKAMDIIRAVDKLDRIGPEGVASELGKGREDAQSGAFIPGLGLEQSVIDQVVDTMQATQGTSERGKVIEILKNSVGATKSGERALKDLKRMDEALTASGYDEDRVVFDSSIARGLAYYTGPVFEAVSKLEYRDEKGNPRRYGSICGGGRYDGLVQSLLGMKVPATGASIGVDRLSELLMRLETGKTASGPVIIIVMEPERLGDYEAMADEIREGGVPAEVYYGSRRKMKAQMSYADSRNAPAVVIAGSSEFDKGTVSVKDLRKGKEASSKISDREQWTQSKPGQVEVPRKDLVKAIEAVLSEESNHV